MYTSKENICLVNMCKKIITPLIVVFRLYKSECYQSNISWQKFKYSKIFPLKTPLIKI